MCIMAYCVVANLQSTGHKRHALMKVKYYNVVHEFTISLKQTHVQLWPSCDKANQSTTGKR